MCIKRVWFSQGWFSARFSSWYNLGRDWVWDCEIPGPTTGLSPSSLSTKLFHWTQAAVLCWLPATEQGKQEVRQISCESCCKNWGTPHPRAGSPHTAQGEGKKLKGQGTPHVTYHFQQVHILQIFSAVTVLRCCVLPQVQQAQTTAHPQQPGI